MFLKKLSASKKKPQKPVKKAKKAAKRVAAKTKKPSRKEGNRPEEKATENAKPAVAAAPSAEQPHGPQNIPNLPLIVHGQYVRDASFENPSAPHALRAGHAAPKMNVNFGLDARQLSEPGLENMFEVVLTVSVEATREGKPVFIAEVQYGTTVSVGATVPKEQIHPLLLIEVPRLAFPFARQILCDMAVQGGYPPLLVAPVNFQQLYIEKFKNELAKKAKA
jgi:preprotein translocase subunit SecB